MVAHGAPRMEREQWGSLPGKGLNGSTAPSAGNIDAGTPTDFTFGHKMTGGTTVLVFNVAFARVAARN